MENKHQEQKHEFNKGTKPELNKEKITEFNKEKTAGLTINTNGYYVSPRIHDPHNETNTSPASIPITGNGTDAASTRGDDAQCVHVPCTYCGELHALPLWRPSLADTSGPDPMRVPCAGCGKEFPIVVTAPARRLLSVAEAADRLNVSPRTLVGYIERGMIAFVQVTEGGAVKIEPAEIARFVREYTQKRGAGMGGAS